MELHGDPPFLGTLAPPSPRSMTWQEGGRRPRAKGWQLVAMGAPGFVPGGAFLLADQEVIIIGRKRRSEVWARPVSA